MYDWLSDSNSMQNLIQHSAAGTVESAEGTSRQNLFTGLHAGQAREHPLLVLRFGVNERRPRDHARPGLSGSNKRVGFVVKSAFVATRQPIALDFLARMGR
ncbi:unnamed protein product [Ectocarpus sp. 8 AP-2014]